MAEVPNRTGPGVQVSGAPKLGFCEGFLDPITCNEPNPTQVRPC